MGKLIYQGNNIYEAVQMDEKRVVFRARGCEYAYPGDWLVYNIYGKPDPDGPRIFTDKEFRKKFCQPEQPDLFGNQGGRDLVKK